MNAGEIEDEISKLAEAPFDAQSFPYQFLQAFGVNAAALAKLQAGRDNKSDVPGGVLQRARNNIHLKACPVGEVAATLEALRNSEATKKLKAKYVLATDGQVIAAERLRDGETLACDYKDLPDHFGILLDLAGISTTPRIEENTFDIRATSKLNKLYVELLRHNPDWGTDARRQDLNHFFARLIFCYFAEDTGIFDAAHLFTDTVEKYTDRTGSNVHEILTDLFRAMDTRREDRATADLRPVAFKFPYVNGNLFGGNADAPRFTQAARIYLLAVGSLDWKHVNPDIFGSMIQAVADDEERGALGMHYTSVPNILKVLNPLFLDDLRQKLTDAGDGSTPASKGQLKRLRDRLARIRVFDPACGSGNFLVIAYKEMRKIEAVINERREETDLPSVIPSTNFRGIEIRHFAAEIARLALIIAKFQCDVLHIGDLFARKQVLPLKKENWITCGNALRLDWLQICPPTGTGVKIENSEGCLFAEKLDQAEIDFENAGGETYICGNPPYIGDKMQLPHHKNDVEAVLVSLDRWRSLDYACAFFAKAKDHAVKTTCEIAFVTTKSIAQGQQVSIFWPFMLECLEIAFAHIPFEWSNLATSNAGVTCVIIGLRNPDPKREKRIFDNESKNAVSNISPYLLSGPSVVIEKVPSPLNRMPKMVLGNVLKDDGHLQLTSAEVQLLKDEGYSAVVRKIVGSTEFVNGINRNCIYLRTADVERYKKQHIIAERLDRVAGYRRASRASALRQLATKPNIYYFHLASGSSHTVCVPRVTSATREYLPVGFLPRNVLLSDRNYGLVDAPTWIVAFIASRLHWVWIGTVCVRMRTDFSYSNTLGWNTFPVPTLTEQNKADLTWCAEDILLAREAYFPATIAEMYDPERMDKEFPELRAAHERNDETLERIYIGRRFRNDTERLEKLFAMYTEMTANQATKTRPTSRRTK